MNITLNKRMKELGITKIEDNDYEYNSNDNIIYVYSKTHPYISFKWSYFPSCCGIYILHYIQDYFIGMNGSRNAEIMTYVMKKICRDNTSCCMCTLSDVDAINFMKEQGWEVINEFHNENSGNEVSILTLKV
jgi:hypothetical protein